jgi:hypothetical protein
MALEPTSVQRDKMLAQGKTKLTLVQFLVPKDPAKMEVYLTASQRSVLAEKGTRDHQLRIDQLVTGSEMPYQVLTADTFPSSQALLQFHEYTREIRGDSLSEIYAMIVKPNPMVKKVTKSLGFLSSLLTNLFGTAEIKGLEQIKDHSDRLDPDTDPDAEKILDFSSEKLDKSFYMMNLNQFHPGGKSAYNQYSARIMPRLISVGGYPDIYGEILSTYIGDQKNPLFNRWHDFALVYYPSRTSFLRLMTNTPRGAAEVRRNGLKRVVLMSCTNNS